MTRVIILLISTIISTAVTFPQPANPPPHTMPFEISNNDAEGIEHFNEIKPEKNNSTSIMEIISDPEEEVVRDGLIPEFLSKVLPSSSLFPSSQTVDTNFHVAPKSSSNTLSQPPSLSTYGFLSRLFSNVVIGRPSIFRVQVYNSDFEDGSSPDGDNSTQPNAVFGSPLCFGLCVPVQVISENTSLHFLSDKQISIFPPVPSAAPLLYAETAEKDANVNQREQQQVFNASETIINEKTNGTFAWLTSWIPATPSLSQIQSILQLPELFK